MSGRRASSPPAWRPWVGTCFASFLVGLMLPFALVTWSGLALSGDPSTVGFRILLPSLLILAAQPFVAAWIAQQGLSLFGAGNVTYPRACGAMALGLVVTIFSAGFDELVAVGVHPAADR